MKICQDCNEAEAHIKRRGRCVPCAEVHKANRVKANNERFYRENREREKARSKKYKDDNPELVREKAKADLIVRKDEISAKRKKWRQENKDRIREQRHRDHLRNKEKENARSRAYKEANKVELADKQSKYNKEKPEGNRFRRSLRRAAEKQATPSWADKAKMRAIYAEAARLTKETGIMYHVDHIYPLQSDWCCGLHVETNLQILTAFENQSKKNRQPLSSVAVQ
jgi:hypothetical protein